MRALKSALFANVPLEPKTVSAHGRHSKHTFEFIPTTMDRVWAFILSSVSWIILLISLLTCLPGSDFSPFQALFHAAATVIFQTLQYDTVLLMPMHSRSIEDKFQIF